MPKDNSANVASYIVVRVTLSEWVIEPDVALIVIWELAGVGGFCAAAFCDGELEHPIAAREKTPNASKSTILRVKDDLRRMPAKASIPNGDKNASANPRCMLFPERPTV